MASPPKCEGRIKRLYSIHQKAQRQKRSLDQVYDLLAVRIITDFGAQLLRRAGRRPSNLAAGARPVQGLHRHAAAQSVSVSAHHGDSCRAAL